MKTKINYLFILLFVIGCQTNKTKQKIAVLPIPAPPPPPSVSPPSPPPNFIPDINDVKELQVNRLPQPFNVNGYIPYAVWVDGKKLPLNSKELKALGLALNLKFTQPEDTAEIHSGEGWLFPKKLNKNTFPPRNNFVEKKKEYNSPELFIDN